MVNVRLWHSYLAIFTAPTIVFFALTGALQLFDFHAARDGYQPATVIAKLAMLHKKQIYQEPRQRPPSQTSSTEARPIGGPAKREIHEKSIATLFLKGFSLLAALALTATAGLGLWIGLTHNRYKFFAWAIFGSGIIIPLILVCV